MKGPEHSFYENSTDLLNGAIAVEILVNLDRSIMLKNNSTYRRDLKFRSKENIKPPLSHVEFCPLVPSLHWNGQNQEKRPLLRLEMAKCILETGNLQLMQDFDELKVLGLVVCHPLPGEPLTRPYAKDSPCTYCNFNK
jgi:hypothetical protein